MDDHALVGFEEALQSMAHQKRGRIVPSFLTGYQLKAEGVTSPVSRREWGKHVSRTYAKYMEADLIG
jgi:hypothetical protein